MNNISAQEIEICNSTPILVEVEDKSYGKNDRTNKYFKMIELVILTFTAFSFLYVNGIAGILSLISLSLLLLVILYSLYSLFILGNFLPVLGSIPTFFSSAWIFYYGDRIAYIAFALAVIFMFAEITYIHTYLIKFIEFFIQFKINSGV